ncbi:MAG: T9SS type A sorting domain-containing protein [Bacteroidetes bacterium]|nr:T9SS type A sorting domain-containing protein [Bacteroidota bacterium]
MFSQYKKVPIDTNHYWRQGSVANASVSNCSYEYQIRYVKDTVIASKTYNKYSEFGAAFGNTLSPCSPNHIKNGFLRQDTINKRVFVLDNSFNERPLYNFTKIAGDTMLVYQNNLNANITVTVTTIDSIQFTDGKYHKYQIVVRGSTYQNSFIQGLGAVKGGLYANQGVGFLSSADEFYCFGTILPFSVLYTTNQKPCFLSNVGLKGNSEENEFAKIYPNSVKDKLTIEYLNNYNNSENKISISNSLGQVVFSLKDFASKNELDLSFLSSGLYYLRIKNASEQKAFKIIKE